MEFRAPEGHVGLPQWLMDSLNVVPGQSLQVHLSLCGFMTYFDEVRRVSLPKGLFCELQPLSSRFKRIPNVKCTP